MGHSTCTHGASITWPSGPWALSHKKVVYSLSAASIAMELLPRREMRSRKKRQPKDMIATLTPLSCCSRWQPKAESTNAVILRSCSIRPSVPTKNFLQQHLTGQGAWVRPHQKPACANHRQRNHHIVPEPSASARKSISNEGNNLGDGSRLPARDVIGLALGRQILFQHRKSLSLQLLFYICPEVNSRHINQLGRLPLMNERAKSLQMWLSLQRQLQPTVTGRLLSRGFRMLFQGFTKLLDFFNQLVFFFAACSFTFLFCFLACEDEDEEEVEEEDEDRFFFFLWVLRLLSLVVAACEKGASSDLRLRRPCPWSWWSCRRRSRLPSRPGRGFATSAVPPYAGCQWPLPPFRPAKAQLSKQAKHSRTKEAIGAKPKKPHQRDLHRVWVKILRRAA